MLLRVIILSGKENFFLVDIPKEEYQNYQKREGSDWSCLRFLWLLSAFLPDLPQGPLVVKALDVDGKIVVIFPF